VADPRPLPAAALYVRLSYFFVVPWPTLEAPRKKLIVVPAPFICGGARCASQEIDHGYHRGAAQVLDRVAHAVSRGGALCAS
jgi:hypothetical protein